MIKRPDNNKKKGHKRVALAFLVFVVQMVMILSVKSLFAQGLTIPTGSTLNVNTGTLNVGGDVDIQGVLQVTTGTIKLTGNWANSGTYTMNTGTVNFNGTSGTQTCDSGGIVAGKSFYDFIHSGNSLLRLINNAVNVDNNFTNFSGTVDLYGQDMTIAGDWNFSPSSTLTDSQNSSTVTLDGTDQNIIGSTNAFYNLTKVGTDSLIFDSSYEQFVRGQLTLQGIGAGSELTLNSNNAPNQFRLNLMVQGTQAIEYIDVSNSDATGIDLIAVSSTGIGQNNDDQEAQPHWVFGAAEYTWQGDIDSDWNKKGNWDLGTVPGASDSVVIPDVTGSGGSQPIMGSDATLTNLSLQQDATLDMNGYNLTVSSSTSIGTDAQLTSRGGDIDFNSFSNDGTVSLFGYEDVSLGVVDVDSGTFAFTGDSDGLNEDFTIPDIDTDAGDVDYYNVVINSTVSPDRFLSDGSLYIKNNLNVTSSELDISTNTDDLRVDGDITLSGGTLTATNGNIDANGDITITSGTFVAPDDSQTFRLRGDFTQSGGSFTHSSGTVIFDGSSQTVSGDGTVFYGFTKAVTSDDTLTFARGVSTAPTIAGNLILTGTSGNILDIQSDIPGTQAPIRLETGGLQTLEYLKVRDSDATGGGLGGVLLVARNSSAPDGNNSNWTFDGAVITWQGDDSVSPTDWNTEENWDLGIVPGEKDTAVIADVTNDPVLDSSVTVENLTINTNGILYLNGNELTVEDELSNNGSVSALGNETINIHDFDIDSGTFIYTGNDDGNPDSFDIAQAPSPNAYFNLVIDDANATPDTFVAARNITVYNNLTVSGGTLDISTNSRGITTYQTLAVDGGTLDTADGDIDANNDVVISSGELIAPDENHSFTVARDFIHSGGTFTHSSGTVELDSSTTATIAGDTTFYNLSCSVEDKEIDFTAGSNQTIENNFNFYGNSTTQLVLRSTTSGVRWDVTFPNSEQSVQFLDVQDSAAVTNDIYCYACTGDTQNNNNRWIFVNLAIEIPKNNKTIDTTPTILGFTDPNQPIIIKDQGGNTIATTTSDANGNFLVEVDSSNALSPGANTLSVESGSLTGNTVTGLTIVTNPTINQQPNVTSHNDGDRLTTRIPTIIGKGLPSSDVVIRAKDANGNLLLQQVGSGTVDGDGNYSVALTTNLEKGENYLVVVVDGVASDILELLLTDPFGTVFISTDNSPVGGATVTLYRASDNQPASVADGDLHAGDVNPVVTGSDGFFSFIAANGDYYFTVEAEGYDYPSQKTSFPPGRSVVTGSKAEVFTVSGTALHVDQPVDTGLGNFRIEKQANKDETTVGGVVTYTITVQSLLSIPYNNVSLEDKIPAGFKFLDGRVKLDGVPIADPQGERPLIFDLGSFTPGQTKVLQYQLVVGSGVGIGTYENTAFVKNSINDRMSNKASDSVKVVLDPLLDLGTVIGKVFFDRNENGIQDAPEYVHMDRDVITEGPVPNVRIVMEDGTVITTDENGRFSAPALMPGRHLFRVDERSLPEGSYLTTDKVVIVNVTEGLMVKVNFGVNLDYDRFNKDDREFFNQKVNIVQEQTKPEKRLYVALFNDPIPVYNGCFVTNAEFRIFTNYAPLIGHWKLEITDDDTNRVMKTFEGNRFNIYDPILWNGLDYKGERLRVNRNYMFRVYIEDENNHYDQTESFPLNFTTIESEEERKDYLAQYKNRTERYKDWIAQEETKTSFLLDNIPADGQVIQVNPLNTELSSVKIMKDGLLFADIPVKEKQGLTAKELLESRQKNDSDSHRDEISFILPKGDYKVVIQEDSDVASLLPETQRNYAKIQKVKDEVGEPVKFYSKDITVGEDYMFFVGMGDAKVGYNFNTGNMEPVEGDESYRDGFYYEGKLSYYLKGKILGKYLITSSYDSEREMKELFRNLDPDKYYPIYGDDSSIDYSATDTQGNLYLLVEWDKSSVIWGNYSIGFDDTEFSKFSRTLYGGKVDFESLSTTKYGESKSKAVVFRAQAKQKSAHNEFLATGGSLYFLKHKDVIEGSEKITVEVRDEVTGLVVSQKEVKEGSDYQINYKNGRIIFWKAVPMIAQSSSIISDDLLKGDMVYVVVDYEYDVENEYNEANVGARVRQAVTDNVLVGATYVKEEKDSENYELKGTDVTMHLGENATVKAEYAKTVSEAQGSYVSTDGGLTFEELATGESAQGEAYGLSGDAKLFNRLGLSAYYKWIDPNFSTSATTSQQGKELIGAGLVYDLSENTRLTVKQDIQKLIALENLQTQLQVGAVQTSTTMIQIIHEDRRLKLTGEYRRQEILENSEKNELLDNVNEDILALRADYEVNDKMTFSLEQQLSMNDKSKNQTTVGAVLKPRDNLTINAAQTIGGDGTATDVSVTADMSERLSLTGAYVIGKDEDGYQERNASLGTDIRLNDKLQVHTSVGLSDNDETGKTTSLVLGSSSNIDEDTSLDSEIILARGSDVNATTISLGGSSKIDDKTTSEGKVAVSDSSIDGRTTTYTFGTTKKISDEIELASTKTFGRSAEGDMSEETYSLKRIRDGKELEGSLSRKYTDNDEEKSQSNIFGLSGDINDKLAFTASYEKGEVQKYDGSKSDRNALSLAFGYTDENPETGRSIKSSAKVEARFDRGDEDIQQYFMYHSLEGQLSEALKIFYKMELSRTRNSTEDSTDERHSEFTLGAAYRPVMNDRLNFLGRYTYLENQSPSSQEDIANVLEERAHVFSAEAVYDINPSWQIAEKFAYRITEEKVEGFDFVKTHTWLMIHRLNYNLDLYWSLSGEFRTLAQQEAKDMKKGFLLEASRRLGDHAQIGLGYNFTDFNDDLTELSYTSQGPFVRLTGKFYDRTPQELARAKEKWMDDKIRQWAWTMVEQELERKDSPVIETLNEFLYMAQTAYNQGEIEKSRKIYKNIIIAGRMMFQEASEYIRSRIEKEENLKKMQDLADEYIRKKQYEKAKKILKKILAEVELSMVE